MKLSVLIPVYNERTVVARCIALVLAAPLPEPLRSLAPGELDLVQLVLEHQTMVAVLDAHPGSDLDACAVMAGLLQRKIIVTETPPAVGEGQSGSP